MGLVDRVVYSEIKGNLLSYYLRGCRDHGMSGWTHRQVCSWAYNEFEGGYDYHVEHLMLEVASLMLSGAWYSDLADYHLGEIARILSIKPLDDFLINLSPEEAEEFIMDLKVAAPSVLSV